MRHVALVCGQRIGLVTLLTSQIFLLKGIIENVAWNYVRMPRGELQMIQYSRVPSIHLFVAR